MSAPTGSQYLLQIIHKQSGKTVTWVPGHPIEIAVPDELCRRLEARGVGMLVSEATVLKMVREEFAKMLFDLKSQV